MRPGAPDALTEENERLIFEAIRNGSSLATAAAIAGLHRSTVEGWRRIGTQAKGKKASERTSFERRCMKFVTKLARNQAEAVLSFEKIINDIAHDSKDPRLSLKAAMWWLERRQPEDYSSRQEILTKEEQPKILTSTEAFEILESIFGKEESE